MPEARRFTIKGRVQGVFFRDSTRREALALGLTGYAINLPNGDVEVLACGESAALTTLQRWLAEGPPLSSVESVVADVVQEEEHDGFATG